jgi:hypothetical protein
VELYPDYFSFFPEFGYTYRTPVLHPSLFPRELSSGTPTELLDFIQVKLRPTYFSPSPLSIKFGYTYRTLIFPLERHTF